MRTRIETRTPSPESTCDSWWQGLTEDEKSAIWIFIRMVSQLEPGGSVEVRRHAESFRAVWMDPEEIRRAKLN